MEKEQLRKSLAIILKRLVDEEFISQKDIAAKLKYLDYSIGKASISNLYRAKTRVGYPLMLKAKKGLDAILRRDLCIKYNDQSNDFSPIEGCNIDPIPTSSINYSESNNFQSIYKIHNERLNTSEKLKLYTSAKEEIFEIGIRLRSFKTYFHQTADSKFLIPIVNRLKEGVNFKCYVADPKSSKLINYISELSEAVKSESNMLNDIQIIQDELAQIFKSINQENGPGKFQFFKYQRSPNYHATVIDPKLSSGAMYISPYLYGQRRANIPVIEIHKDCNRKLFEKYWKSIKAFTTSTPKSKVIPISIS